MFCISQCIIFALDKTKKNIMKTLISKTGRRFRIKFVYEKGHKFYGQVFYYVNDVRQGYRDTIECVNEELKEEDKIKLPE